MFTLQIFIYLIFYLMCYEAIDPCTDCSCTSYWDTKDQTNRIYIDCKSIEPTTNQLQLFQIPNNTGVFDLSTILSTTHIDINNQWLIYEQLISLIISFNSIENLNLEPFKYMKSLRVLDLSHNKLSALDESSLKGLDALESLDLSHNYFQQVPSQILSLTTPRLKVLMIGINPLSEASFLDWHGPATLQQLVVDYANITSPIIWPDSQILELNLRGNLFTTIPKLPSSLTILDLSNTQLSNITKNAFIQTYNLQTLLLEDISTDIIIENQALYGLKKLTKFSMDGCHKLNHIPANIFDPDAQLLDVSLENCNLTTLDEKLILSFNNAVLDLDGNPWICDCNLTWIEKYLEIPIVCNKPDYLSGHLFPGNIIPCSKYWIKAQYGILMGTITALLVLIVISISLILLQYYKYHSCMVQSRHRIETACPCLKKLNFEEEEELYSADPYEVAFEPFRIQNV